MESPFFEVKIEIFLSIHIRVVDEEEKKGKKGLEI